MKVILHKDSADERTSVTLQKEEPEVTEADIYLFIQALMKTWPQVDEKNPESNMNELNFQVYLQFTDKTL